MLDSYTGLKSWNVYGHLIVSDRDAILSIERNKKVSLR